MNLLTREPVIVFAFLRQLALVAASFGILDEPQTAAIVSALGLLLELVTAPKNRAMVSPVQPPSSGGTGTRLYFEGSGKQPSDPPPTAARVALAVLAAAVLTGGCAGSLNEARSSGQAARVGAGEPKSTPDRCASLDDRRAVWGGIGKGAAVLAGGSGISTLPLDEHPELQTGAAIGAAVMAAIAAGAVYVSESAGDSWARECSAP
jgi:hypothetical protein